MAHEKTSEEQRLSDENEYKASATEPSKLPAWIRYAIVGLLILGIFFRFYNLDRKVYWTDEALTSLRMSGHTKTELVDTLFTGKVVSVEAIQQYQRPDGKTLGDTWNALTSTTEHTPLYFLLVRLWGEGFGYSVAAVRSVSAVVSLLSFLGLFWLCWELFQSTATAWVALGLFAITPMHILYAQEARPYSLWTVCILLSSALLLRAIRKQTRLSWIGYAASLVVGLYTQLLFGTVAIAHAVYIAGIERVVETRRLSKTVYSYLLATIAALILFAPWLTLLITHFDRVRETTASLSAAHSFFYLVDRWFLGINRALMGEDLGSANLLLVLLVIYALGFLWYNAPRHIWLFILTLIGVPFLLLALPDIFLGGVRSTRIRYFIPSIIGIQLAFAYLFAVRAVWAKTWGQKLWRMGLIVLVVSNLMACGVISQAQVWWNKGYSRSTYYPQVSSLINQANQALVISDGRPSEILALSYWLDPDVKLQLVTQPNQLNVAKGFRSVFLLNPSKKLQNTLKKNYRLTSVYEDPRAVDGEDERLLRVRAAK